MEKPITLRPEVQAFAELMELKLRKNDDKPGWKNDDPRDLFMRVRDEMVELADAIAEFPVGGAGKMDALDASMNVGNETADLANFAMMIADVCGALK